MNGKVLLALVCGGFLSGNGFAADSVTVISYGGASKEAQVGAFYKPFERHSRKKVVAGEWNGEMAKLKAMVSTNSTSWDVLDVEDTDLARGCEEGLFEKLDHDRLGIKDPLVEGTRSECGLGIFVWSNVLAYNADKLKEAPQGWSDFWDLKKFPGKCSLRKSARGSLEFALMADGVPPAEVYTLLATPAGVDRAFAKLDQIKSSIQWWEAGAQPPQYLMAGDVVMSSAYNGRIHAAKTSGANLQVVWSGNLYQFDDWAIPKGTPNLDAAYDFIAFSMRPEQQKLYTEKMAYGPSNTAAAALLSKDLEADLPTNPANMKNALQMDVNFWLDHGEALEERFMAWSSR
ncbi:ABC transporter substrate-binding protein [Pseudomonas huaxiensis]|uniref:ABC transporter substrate-binding protein n=1 Tax=Pseudomonas huaxiensis TaxID=2213017 RepID=UPI000DA69788|nr:ABC transporter substrate-binding protein [Pseudomonas huaxiensis]